MPSAPRPLRPWTTSSGMRASRSICSGSTFSSRKARRRSRKRSPFSTAAGSSRGCGWIRSRRKFPRNSSLPKLGSSHSLSRAASATSRASFSVTFPAISSSWLELMPPVGTRRGHHACVQRYEQLLHMLRLPDKEAAPGVRKREMATTTGSERVPVPRDRDDDYTREAATARADFIREQTGQELEHVTSYSFDPSTLTGNVEQFVGVAQVPIGLAGPLLVNGEHAQGEFYVPLATAEGTLVA